MSQAHDNDSAGFRTVAYFVNWAIYGREHHPQDLPADKLTHVLYAFANVRPESGEVYLTDAWSDTDKHYPSDSWNEPTPGPHLYGCLKQLALLKRRNRNLKTLLSIGGWTYSSNFAPAASSHARRVTFASTAVQLLKDCGFDGLDIDWEYPRDATEAVDFVQLLGAVRAALDTAAAAPTPKAKFLLTVACPAGPQNFRVLEVSAMDKYLDFWNLMAYDFSGGWDDVAGHQANIYPDAAKPAATPFSAAAAVEYFAGCGVARGKIVLGCPLYGRAFVGTAGPGQAYRGGVGEGSWEKGIWDWKVLPVEAPSVRIHEDQELLASWSYDSKTETMVSFDAIGTVERKTRWVQELGLGGVMWWESSGDRKVGKGSAIEKVADMLGGGLERKKNVVDYPQSKYENLRNGFPGE